MGRGAWRSTVCGVARSRTWLSFQLIRTSFNIFKYFVIWLINIEMTQIKFYTLTVKKLCYKQLKSHVFLTILLDFTLSYALEIIYIYCIHWRRKWQPSPVFLPGKSHGQRSLAGCSPWDHKESDTTERLTTQLYLWSGYATYWCATANLFSAPTSVMPQFN